MKPDFIRTDDFTDAPTPGERCFRLSHGSDDEAIELKQTNGYRGLSFAIGETLTYISKAEATALRDALTGAIAHYDEVSTSI